VNYRGSTGFGLEFLNASTHQWGRGTQEDLYDAVKWAIDQGIADPKRVAAYGWSGGGYATLRALTQRPDLFACGMDGVGPADIATLFKSFPTYWDGILAPLAAPRPAMSSTTTRSTARSRRSITSTRSARRC
jgi:dipeptidyl aminopeptidase/acylaminoacyl peptidase